MALGKYVWIYETFTLLGMCIYTKDVSMTHWPYTIGTEIKDD